MFVGQKCAAGKEIKREGGEGAVVSQRGKRGKYKKGKNTCNDRLFRDTVSNY